MDLKLLLFGLTSASATCECQIEKLLKGLHWKVFPLYMDDVIICSSELDSRGVQLEDALQCFWTAGLKLKPRKCEVFRTEVNQLGHVVTTKKIATNPGKVVAVRLGKGRSVI